VQPRDLGSGGGGGGSTTIGRGRSSSSSSSGGGRHIRRRRPCRHRRSVRSSSLQPLQAREVVLHEVGRLEEREDIARGAALRGGDRRHPRGVVGGAPVQLAEGLPAEVLDCRQDGALQIGEAVRLRYVVIVVISGGGGAGRNTSRRRRGRCGIRVVCQVWVRPTRRPWVNARQLHARRRRWQRHAVRDKVLCEVGRQREAPRLKRRPLEERRPHRPTARRQAGHACT